MPAVQFPATGQRRLCRPPGQCVQSDARRLLREVLLDRVLAQVDHRVPLQPAVFVQIGLHRVQVGSAAAEKHNGMPVLADNGAGVARSAHQGDPDHVPLQPDPQSDTDRQAERGRRQEPQHPAPTPEQHPQQDQYSQDQQGVPPWQIQICSRQRGAPADDADHPVQPQGQQQAGHPHTGQKERHGAKQQNQDPQHQRRAEHPHHQQVGQHRNAAGGHPVRQQRRQRSHRGQGRRL